MYVLARKCFQICFLRILHLHVLLTRRLSINSRNYNNISLLPISLRQAKVSIGLVGAESTCPVSAKQSSSFCQLRKINVKVPSSLFPLRSPAALGPSSFSTLLRRILDGWILAGRGQVDKSTGKRAFVIPRDSPQQYVFEFAFCPAISKIFFYFPIQATSFTC